MAGPCLLAISTRRPPLCRSLPGRRKGRRNGAEHHPKRVEALKENGRYEHGWIGTTSWGNIERRRNLDVIFLPKKFLHAVYSVFWIVNSVLGYGFLQQGRVGLLGIVKRLCFHLRRILDVDGDGRASISCYARGLLDDEHGVFRRGPEAGARVQSRIDSVTIYVSLERPASRILLDRQVHRAIYLRSGLQNLLRLLAAHPNVRQLLNRFQLLRRVDDTSSFARHPCGHGTQNRHRSRNIPEGSVSEKVFTGHRFVDVPAPVDARDKARGQVEYRKSGSLRSFPVI